MRLTVNGKELNFSNGNTVRQLLEQLHLAERPAAVERNGLIVPHSTFDQTELVEGDILEVVTLVGGGLFASAILLAVMYLLSMFSVKMSHV